MNHLIYVLCFIERKEKAVTFLEKEGKGWLPILPSEQNCKAKALTSPLLWDHPACTCAGILQPGASSPAAVPGPFAGRLGSHSSPPSSRCLSAAGTKAHRSRQLNQSTNWGGECAPTSLLKCITITRGGWKTIGFEEESWWGRKIVSYLRRMELNRCGQCKGFNFKQSSSSSLSTPNFRVFLVEK